MEFSFPDLFLKSEHIRGRRSGQSKGSKISGNFLNWVKRANPDPAKTAGRLGSSDLPTLSIFSSGISNPLDLINLEPKTGPDLKPGKKWVKKGGVTENSLDEAAQVATLLAKKAELGLNGAKMAVSPKESAKDLAAANASDSKTTVIAASGKQKGQEPGTAQSNLLAMLKKNGVGKELRAGNLKGSADRELSKADNSELNSSKHNGKGSKSANELTHEMAGNQISGAKDAEARLKQAQIEGATQKKATESGPEGVTQIKTGNQKTGKSNDQTGKDHSSRHRHQGMSVHEGYEAEVISRESSAQTTSRLNQKSREVLVNMGQRQASELPHTNAEKQAGQTSELASGLEQIKSATQVFQGDEKVGKLKATEKPSLSNQGKSQKDRIGKDGKTTQRPYVGSEPQAGSGTSDEKAQAIDQGAKGHTSAVKPDSGRDPFGIAMGTENKSGPASTSSSKGRTRPQHWSDYAQDAAKAAPSSEPAAIQKTTTPEGTRVPQPLFNQVEDGLKQAFILRPKSITVKLTPDDLGEIRVKVSIENDNLHARIQTDSARVTSILKDQQGELEHRLRDQGIDLKKFDISDNSQGQQGNQEPHQRNPEQATHRNGNGRRPGMSTGQENRMEPQAPVQAPASPSITPGQPVNITI